MRTDRRKKSCLVFAIILGFTTMIFSQKINEPKLVGSWSRGEDFGEFIYHKIQEFNYHLGEDPNGKLVAQVCSKEKLPLALVISNGFAYQFLEDTRNQSIPDRNVYFARSSKCRDKTEQFWFLPENTSIENDEMLPAEKVAVSRFIESYYDNPDSTPARKEFEKNTWKFIQELKNNPKTQGFIILNLKTKNSYLQKALREIQKNKIKKNRFQIISKKLFETNFPEYITVSIKE